MYSRKLALFSMLLIVSNIALASSLLCAIDMVFSESMEFILMDSVLFSFKKVIALCLMRCLGLLQLVIVKMVMRAINRCFIISVMPQIPR